MQDAMKLGLLSVFISSKLLNTEKPRHTIKWLGKYLRIGKKYTNEKCIPNWTFRNHYWERYHSRLKVEVPTMVNNQKQIITFIHHDNLPVPSQIPIKSHLIQMIKKSNINSEHIVDAIAKENGCEDIFQHHDVWILNVQAI